MKMMTTPLGFLVDISISDKELWDITYSIMTGIAGCQDLESEEVIPYLEKAGNLFDSLFAFGIGYAPTSEYGEYVVPIIEMQGEDTIYIFLTNPAVGYLYGASRAQQMLRQICSSGEFPMYEMDDDDFIDDIVTQYTYFEEQEDEFKEDDNGDEDEDTEDEDGDEEGNEDENETSGQEAIKTGDKEPDTKDLPKTASLPNLYRLAKSSDVYRYKQIARMFYLFKNGKIYMEVKDDKPYIISGLSDLRKCRVDVKYATPISPASL